MKFEILLNSIIRISIEKAMKLLENYKKEVGFKNFAEQQKISDVLTRKLNVRSKIKEEILEEALMCLVFMSKGTNPWSRAAFEVIKEYPMMVWIECIGEMDSDSILSLLDHYHEELTAILMETFIIHLPEEGQLLAIDKYKSQLNSEDGMFSNFYYSVSDKARIKLKEYFPNQIEDDILLELQDLDEEIVVEKLFRERERFMKLPADDLIELILLKLYKLDTLNRFLELFHDKVKECSIPKFEFFITRYKNLGSGYYDGKESQSALLTDYDLFQLFKDKFHQIGVEETLSLFDHRNYSKGNTFTASVVLDLLDIAYADSDLSNYVDYETIVEIMRRFVEKCNRKDYSIDELERCVKRIGKDGKTKLIFDDYIEAIIACGKLLKNGVMNDQHPLFLELRDKFTTDLLGRCKKDGSYLENISFNGIFYRLAKGSMPFDKVYMTKTYKGLIYLSKCGQWTDNADYITSFLTDEQLAKLNINPVIKWRNIIPRTNQNHLPFVERMSLQLLCYFGREGGKYLLESDMRDNRMENLFDHLNYGTISIHENGDPNINEELIRYLFGKGKRKEPNSVMNRMIRGDIPEFEKYFTEFCNSFDEVKKICNGILSVKRIVKHFADIDLPMELKPDEIGFKQALMEMNTTDFTLLSEAIDLCKDARNRGYSSIPKVEGQFGDFTYKILNLDDPMAVAVGYLSQCCFVVRGISYSALKHSMQSRNGRTFVVYYKGQFLVQSWVWRNGDVICFDSVEAGCTRSCRRDNIKLVEVYKKAGQQMLSISQEAEDDIQKVKFVTVGRSDYIFNGLKKIKLDRPRPLENDIYAYDSDIQQVLAGSVPKEPRYGVVGAQYKDPRKRVIAIQDVDHASIEILDEAAYNINSLRYQMNGEELPLEYQRYTKMLSGDDWYILVQKDGVIESGFLDKKEETKIEYYKYLDRLKKINDLDREKSLAKQLKPLFGNKR